MLAVPTPPATLQSTSMKSAHGPPGEVAKQLRRPMSWSAAHASRSPELAAHPQLPHVAPCIPHRPQSPRLECGQDSDPGEVLTTSENPAAFRTPCPPSQKLRSVH